MKKSELRQLIREESIKLNESTGDGTIESFIEFTKQAQRAGIFNDELFKEVKNDFVEGIRTSLKADEFKIPEDKRKEFEGYVKALMTPIVASTTFNEFIQNLLKVSVIKQNIVKRLQISEVVNESINYRYMFDTMKNKILHSKDNISDWWNKNKNLTKKHIVDFLVNDIASFVVNIASKI